MATGTPVTLAYNLVEPENGRDENASPIIFVHGLTGVKEQWRDITQIVANRTFRKVYAVDARNHGDTEFTNEFSIDLNVIDLLHFMDTVRISKAILVGHSMGGETVIRTALTKPYMVEKMISVDMPPKGISKDLAEMAAGMFALLERGIQSIPQNYDKENATSFLIDFLHSNIPPDIPAVLPSKEKMRILGESIIKKPNGRYRIRCNMPVIFEVLKSLPSNRTKATGRFDGPAVFFYGELSPFGVLQEEKNIKMHFPQAELVEIKGASHNPQFETPELFLEHLLNCF